MPRGGRRPGAGRPAGKPNRDTAASRAALADLVAGHVETAIKTLSDIAQNGESESARVSAATAILDRAYGRPGQAVEVTDMTPVMPDVIEIRGVHPISSESEAEIDAARRPDGTLDFSQLSDATLTQIVDVGDLVERVS